MTTSLVVHRGARVVDRAELERVAVPPPTDTWFPLSHAAVLERSLETLDSAGFVPARVSLALSSDNARFFGTIDLRHPISQGVTLAVGIRNSIDKSLPIGFAAGNRVFVCDNLAFRSEIVVSRKHTKFGETRFGEAIAKAVGTLPQFAEAEYDRIKRFQYTDLSADRAYALILRAYEKEIISHYHLSRVLGEWKNPSFEEFEPRTLWSLENAFTTVLGDLAKKNPQRFCGLTIALQGLLSQAAGLVPDVPADAPAFTQPA